MPTGEPDHAISPFSTGETEQKCLAAVAVRSVPQNCLRHRLCLCRFFCGSQVKGNVVAKHAPPFKVARYSFSGSIPFKFEHKLLRHKQRFGKIDTTVALDKDENLL